MWLSDVKLILVDRIIENGALRIENGMIVEITESKGQPSGFTVFPGFIDMHGDMIEIELEPRPKVDFPMYVAVGHLDARLAAAGRRAPDCVSTSDGADAEDGDSLPRSLFAGFACSQLLFMLSTGLTWAYASIGASRSLHRDTTTRLIHAPLSWYEHRANPSPSHHLPLSHPVRAALQLTKSAMSNMWAISGTSHRVGVEGCGGV